jgi:homoserine O-acetyltransferase/O-succinyltransferase
VKKVSLILLFFVNSLVAQDAKQQFFVIGDYPLENGQLLKGCRLGFRTFGKLNADKSNAIMVPTWFSGTSNQKSFVASPAGLADSTKFFVIVVDALGNGVSTSPSNSIAQANEKFPTISIRDMVRAEYMLATEYLKLSGLYAVMGISMGGMQTFQWVVSYPNFVKKAVPIIGTPIQSSYDKLFWSAQLNTLERGKFSQDAMKTVGALHELNLWTPQYHEQKIKLADYEAYIKKKEDDYAAQQNVFNWACQLKAMINHDIFQGDRAMAIRKIKAKILVVVATQDHMVNPASAIALAKEIKAPFVELEGNCGHMATSCEEAKMLAFVKAFLE